MIFLNRRFQISSKSSFQDFICDKNNLKVKTNIDVIWSELLALVIIRAADNSVIMI